MAVRYQESRTGMAEMLRAPFMVEALRRVAEKGKERAEGLTPVDTGRMKASWVVTAWIDRRTARARLANTARNPQSGFPYPLVLERGTRYIRRRRILGRAIDSMRI